MIYLFVHITAPPQHQHVHVHTCVHTHTHNYPHIENRDGMHFFVSKVLSSNLTWFDT